MDGIIYGGIRYSVKRASTNLGASGDVIAAVTGKKLLLLAFYFEGTPAGSFVLSSGSGGAAISPILWVAGSYSAPQAWQWNPAGWAITTAGASLYATLTTTTNLNTLSVYAEVD